MRDLVISLVVLAAAFWTGTTLAAPRTLSIDDRVAAQRAIEEVYWSHRIWPDSNPGVKPRLEDVVTEADLRAKVEEGLRKSNALAKPISPQDLQAEMERMARGSRSPEILIELFRLRPDLAQSGRGGVLPRHRRQRGVEGSLGTNSAGAPRTNTNPCL